MSIQNLTASLDLKQNLNIYATCKQLDTLNLILDIYDNSVQANLTNYDVRLKAMKADNVPLIQEHIGITILSNVVTILGHEQLTTTSGKTLIELQFINTTTGYKKATFNLVLVVVPSTLEVNATISTATYTLLEELENKLDQATDYLKNIDEAIEANNNLVSNIAIANPLNIDLESNIAIGTPLDSSLESNISLGNALKPELDAKNTQATANIEAMESFGDVTALATDLTTVKTEVANARKGKVNLLEKINDIDTQLSEKAKMLTTPQKTIADITYYVATTGLDTNDGLTVGTPFKTIQHAINILPQVINNMITISVASGVYNENINIVGFVGGGRISLVGDSVISSNYVVSSFSIKKNALPIQILGFEANTTTANSVTIDSCSNVYVHCLKSIGVTNTYFGAYSTNSIVMIGDSIISNKLHAIHSSINSNILVMSTLGTNNTVALLSEYNGVIGKAGSVPLGTTQESSMYGGVIR